MSHENSSSEINIADNEALARLAGNREIEAILESVPLGFFDMDSRWRITELNNEAARLVGVPREALIGKRLDELYPSFAGSVFESNYRRVLTEQSEVRFETLSTAQKRWYEVRAYPSSAGISVIFCDTTERKLLQDAIYETVATNRCFIWHATVHDWSGGRFHWNCRAINEKEARQFIELDIAPDAHFVQALDKARFPEEDQAAEELFHRTLQSNGAYYSREFRCIDRFNAVHWLHENAHITALSPTLSRVVGVCTDITERKQIEQALSESEHRFRSAIDAMQEGVVLQAGNQEVPLWNRSAERILGLAPNQMPRYASFNKHLHAIHEDGTEFPFESRPSRRTLRTGVPQHGVIMGVYKPNGELRWLSVNSSPLTLPEKTAPYAVVTTFTDITETRQYQQRLQIANKWLIETNAVLEKQKQELAAANARLEALAMEDGLTGLKNHRAFQEHLAEQFSHKAEMTAPLSLLFLDIDRFKAFNENFGHLAGDNVLKTVAAIIRTHIRRADVAARYGSEEFTILLPDTEDSESMRLAERLRAAIQSYSWPLSAITVSIGVSTQRTAMSAPADLLEAADSAVSAAKARGRNRVVHHCKL